MLAKTSAIQSLYLNNNQLVGAIPPAICNLTSLVELTLHRNGFTGSIPLTFSGLTALHTFDVNGKCLTNFEPVSHVPNLIGADAQVDTCFKGLPWLMLLLD